MSRADMPPEMVLANRQQAIVQNLLFRIDAALALHPRIIDRGVWFCNACHGQRWPCANVRALTGEET